MIYTGFTDNELKKIIEILDRHQVVYELMVPEADNLRKPTRGLEQAVHIEIHKEEFDKIPANDIQKLFDLRIYKEEESPFTEEELTNYKPKEIVKTVDPDAKFKTTTTIIAIVAVVLLALWRKGIFN